MEKTKNAGERGKRGGAMRAMLEGGEKREGDKRLSETER
jgi:hypothetical protein